MFINDSVSFLKGEFIRLFTFTIYSCDMGKLKCLSVTLASLMKRGMQ